MIILLDELIEGLCSEVIRPNFRIGAVDSAEIHGRSQDIADLIDRISCWMYKWLENLSFVQKQVQIGPTEFDDDSI